MKLAAICVLIAMQFVDRGESTPLETPAAEQTSNNIQVTPVRCATGTHSEVAGGVTVYDNEFEALCRPDQYWCATYHYSLAITYNGWPLQINARYGACVSDPEALELTCDIFAHSMRKFGNMTSCRVATCDARADGEACNRAVPDDDAPACRERSDRLDVQIFPNCTMKESAAGVIECGADLFHGYPFENQKTCSTSWSNFISCLSGLVERCLGTNCDSVLDNIPGFRSEYSAVIYYANKIKDMELLDATLGSLGLPIWTLFKPFACPAQ